MRTALFATLLLQLDRDLERCFEPITSLPKVAHNLAEIFEILACGFLAVFWAVI
jgi:hypothetical protein